MTVRFPSAKEYSSQVQKEATWVPYLQENLDFLISKPIVTGQPTDYYSFPWSVNAWVDGETLLMDE